MTAATDDTSAVGLADSPAAAQLDVKNLCVHFFTREGTVQAVDGVSFHLAPGQTLGVVGESGCGKSVTSLSILQVVQPPGRIVGGKILWQRTHGGVVDICSLAPRGKEVQSIRGSEIAMVFQEPMTSFSPVYTIGFQIMEVIIRHQRVGKKEARDRAIEMLAKVGFPAPAERVDNYPHQLSGGLRQRAMIAMAISCQPRLLIADEPTTSLDVTVQAQILELMRMLRLEMGMSILLISHNFGVINELADRVAVMYLGQIVEQAEVREALDAPLHPYTRALLRSVPVLGANVRERLNPVEGTVPLAINLRPGCRFASRCRERMTICGSEDPPMREVQPGHHVRCWLYNR